MKYSETGFRVFDRHFVAVPFTDRLKRAFRELPDAETAAYLLTYGYIDHRAGMTLEVLAAARLGPSGDFAFSRRKPEGALKIRIGSLLEEDCCGFDAAGEEELYGLYREEVDALECYQVSEAVEDSRKMGFLDASRNPEYPDDVAVYLMRDGLQPEGCWVRIEDLDAEDHELVGTLLNEPDQDFGCHQGEKISFYAQQGEKETWVLCADCSGPQDGSRCGGAALRAAIHAFYQDGTQENLMDLFRILWHSTVLIPCNAVISDADQAAFLELIQKEQGSLTGEEVISKDPIRLVPDILQSGDEYYFPLFSDEESMGTYGTHFSIVEKPFPKAVRIARHNPQKTAGIVIDAFTEPFVLTWEILEGFPG